MSTLSVLLAHKLKKRPVEASALSVLLAEGMHKHSVWNKGQIIAGWDENVWRKDVNGKLIRYEDHGNRDSIYGWEKDHIIPIACGGPDILENLRPLYWRDNARLGGLFGD